MRVGRAGPPGSPKSISDRITAVLGRFSGFRGRYAEKRAEQADDQGNVGLAGETLAKKFEEGAKYAGKTVGGVSGFLLGGGVIGTAVGAEIGSMVFEYAWRRFGGKRMEAAGKALDRPKKGDVAS